MPPIKKTDKLGKKKIYKKKKPNKKSDKFSKEKKNVKKNPVCFAKTVRMVVVDGFFLLKRCEWLLWKPTYFRQFASDVISTWQAYGISPKFS